MASLRVHPEHIVRSSHGSRTFLSEQASDRPAQPADDRSLRLVSDTAREASPLARLDKVAACDRQILVQRSGVFTNYVPACTAHQWVGDEVGSEWAAVRQICVAGLHQRIYSSRARELQRRGFSVFEGE